MINLKSIRSIGVHDGVFHADDVVSVALLRIMTNATRFVRTRDMEKLEQCDIILDVGGKYDGIKWFDHHQLEGNDRSALGLLADALFEKQPETLEYLKKEFITAIELSDNGQESNLPNPFSWVTYYNKNWNDDNADQDVAFDDAVAVAIEILCKINNRAMSLDAAEEVVEAAEIEEDGKVIILKRFAPWQETVHKLYPNALYIVFPNQKGDAYNVQAVPVEPGKFELKRPLPLEWRGKRDKELEELSGISGAVFCHKAGFICAFKTEYEAVKAAIRCSF